MNYHIYSRQNWKKLAQQVQKHISSKLLPFDKLFIAFFESRSTFTHFLKKIRFVAQLFGKLMPPKIVVTWMLNSSRFRTPFGSQRGNGFKRPLQPARQHFLPNFLLMSAKLSWKKWLLVRSWMLGPCFSTLTNYHMYSRQNWKKLAQQVQKHISSKLLPF